MRRSKQGEGRSCGTRIRAQGSTLLLSGALAGLAVLTWGGPSGGPDSGIRSAGAALYLSPSAVVTPEDVDVDVGQIVRQYCVACHNETLVTAHLSLEGVDATDPAADPAIWEKVVTRLRTGTMPPPGIPRPEPEVYRAMADWLEGALDEAWASAPTPNPGRIAAVHRLNRTEYNTAINDILGLDIDVRDQLPGDETADGAFDNFAAVLTISPSHLDQYMAVARRVSRMATGLPPTGRQADRYRASDAKPQDDRMGDDLPLGSRGGLAVRHHFPSPGEYRLSVRMQQNYADYLKGMGWAQEMDLRLNGHLVERFTVGGGGENFRPGPHTYEGAGDGPGWPGSPEWEEYMQLTAGEGLTVIVPVDAGPQLVSVSFPRIAWEPEALLPQPPVQARSQVDAFNADRMGHAAVWELHIEGPMGTPVVAEDIPSRQRLFVCQPAAPNEELDCARRILEPIAAQAFRRPVTQEEIETVLDFFEAGREDGGTFTHGIQFGLERILVDPNFLLRVYREPAAQAAAGQQPDGVGFARFIREAQGSGDPYRLSPLEVASRLSFFLWNTVPDAELVSLARSGDLADPSVLTAQTVRLLQDPRATDVLVQDFASQWLGLRLLDQHTLHDGIYIDYDENLRDAMAQETILFIGSTIQEDRSVLDLLRADYTYLNQRLARHYDIPGVYGSHFRRVMLPNLDDRGGILGHASLLSVTSYPDRTTPVLRGKWLLENILGMDVPAPPPEVDTSLDADEEAAVGSQSIRELLSQHRANPACASCHAVLDPMGFALEGYDAAGGRRHIDERGNPVYDIGTWPTGQEIHGLPGLRDMLLEHREQFVRTVTGKLMAYALGRHLEYYDQPAVRQIVRAASVEDYRWSAIVHGIIQSPQFQMRARAVQAAEGTRSH